MSGSITVWAGAIAAVVAALVAGAVSIFTTRYIYGVERQRQVEAIKPQLEAYRKLWALMEEADLEFKERLTTEKRKHLLDNLLSWYYADGNGIFLTLETRNQLNEAMLLLKGRGATDEQIKKELRKVRVDMRRDLAVYGYGEVRKWGSSVADKDIRQS